MSDAIAVTLDEAARRLSMSWDSLRAARVRVIRGRMVLVPVTELTKRVELSAARAA